MDKKDGRTYWNARARTFPRYEEGDQTYEAGMPRLARDHGVVFADKDVLDVGAGSGMYTLRLAQEAAQVTAVDISDEMLRLLQEDAAAHGLANIRTVRSDWENFTPDRRYEVVFASMTPALDSEAGKEKLLACAAGWVVYMGFLDRMASDLMQGLYAHYGITPRVFNNAQIMEQWLTTRGIRCTALPVKGQWTVSRNREDTLDVCVKPCSTTAWIRTGIVSPPTWRPFATLPARMWSARTTPSRCSCGKIPERPLPLLRPAAVLYVPGGRAAGRRSPRRAGSAGSDGRADARPHGRLGAHGSPAPGQPHPPSGGPGQQHGLHHLPERPGPGGGRGRL